MGRVRKGKDRRSKGGEGKKSDEDENGIGDLKKRRESQPRIIEGAFFNGKGKEG